MSLTSFLGTLAEQLLVLPAVLPLDEPPAADGSPTNSAPATVPLVPMPTPLDQPLAKGTAAQSRPWAPVAEPAPAPIDQPEEERTAAAYPSHLVFGLALAGALVAARERSTSQQRRPGREIAL
jgi:hypothetical protein